jgi:patatin-like phospholipase/acyl hydrolase
MYILDGIVYAGNPTTSIEVESIKVLDDMIMLVTFNNKETKLFDATILEGEAFEPLKDENVFKTAKVEYGVVVWLDGEIDCAPEYMYEHSYKYEQLMEVI